MEKVLHPVSGEIGYFCTELEKEVLVGALEKAWDTICSESSVING